MPKTLTHRGEAPDAADVEAFVPTAACAHIPQASSACAASPANPQEVTASFHQQGKHCSRDAWRVGLIPFSPTHRAGPPARQAFNSFCSGNSSPSTACFSSHQRRSLVSHPNLSPAVLGCGCPCPLGTRGELLQPFHNIRSASPHLSPATEHCCVQTRQRWFLLLLPLGSRPRSEGLF